MYLIPPHLKKIFSSRSPPEDYFPLRGFSHQEIPAHLKKSFSGGVGGLKHLSAGFFLLLAELQHLRDLQPAFLYIAVV